MATNEQTALQQQQNGLGTMTTDMGMSQLRADTAAYGAIQNGTKNAPTSSGQNDWGMRSWGGSQQASTQQQFDPITFNAPPQNSTWGGGNLWSGSSQGSGQNADMWGLASGQQQYSQPRNDRTAPMSPYEQPGGYGGSTQQQGGGWQLPAGYSSPGEMAQTAPANPTSGPGMDLAGWMGLNNDGGQRRSLAEYSQLMQPYLDRSQNSYQYGMDFNEQQRRWNQQNAWQQNMDTANVELSYRQQGLSEEQARIAAQQWNQQFQQTVNNDTFNQGLATRDQALAELQNRQQYGIQDRGMNLQELQNQQRYGLDTRTANLAELQNQQRYGLDQQSAALANRTQDDLVNYRNQQDALGWGGLDQQRYSTDAQTGLGYANVGQQRYSTDVNAAIQKQQILNQYGIDTRGLDLRQQEQLANQVFQRQQLSQQGALQREQMALQERLGTMQAYGRAQAPQAKFIRNW